MPNWCESTYAFITNDLGNKSELKRLYDNLNKIYNSHCPQENDFGDSWLGHIAIIHNIPWENIKCRGSIICMDDFDEDDTYFAIDTETAWEPLSEFWDCILKQYEGISYVYIAEEPGFRLYINTDVSGDIFPDRFIFYNDKGKNMYFKDVIELIKYVNKYLGKTFNSFEEIKDCIDDLKKSKHNMCIDVYKFLEK